MGHHAVHLRVHMYVCVCVCVRTPTWTFKTAGLFMNITQFESTLQYLQISYNQ
jgi:hypothetical protein